ncbi:ATP-binding protein [Actinoallomurus purpureus]|uniref:ATP-binding protein n=1 Tax=Actinoallomurus purpureus TaxID=478114 RepID=UPI0020937AF5|nr:ATP-binding protein [Actinoallomurus purpureus]MCO6011087.1 ATP-binding protein [Actinoallomurus purpureus]
MLHETTPTTSITTMCWRRTFPGRPDQARLVRRFVAFLLEDCRRADDAVQVVAELAGNALIHTRSGRPGGTFVVEVRRGEDCLAISVTDQGGSLEDSGPHTRRHDDDLAENGRGLPIVEDLATHVTWTGDPDHGHTVTATFS